MSWQLLTKAAGHLAKGRLAQPSGRRWWRAAMIITVATSPLTIVPLIILLGAIALGAGAPAAAASGAVGIPPIVFSAYLTAEANADSIAPDCVVDWPIIAGIWRVESNHATTGGRTITTVKARVEAAGGRPELATLHYKPTKSLFAKIKPNYYAAITDEHIIYPWEIDRDIKGFRLRA